MRSAKQFNQSPAGMAAAGFFLDGTGNLKQFLKRIAPRFDLHESHEAQVKKGLSRHADSSSRPSAEPTACKM
jgi:hypothetical protein